MGCYAKAEVWTGRIAPFVPLVNGDKRRTGAAARGCTRPPLSMNFREAGTSVNNPGAVVDAPDVYKEEKQKGCLKVHTLSAFLSS